ncbi:MAG: tetratricopeptide repeat protein [Deltaproteobacteria bacterium]|nr:tetratricopeptide repeat protein [Deltaproteobacteria bacterium]
MTEKSLSEITEPPKPPPEDLERARKEGARIVAYDPDQLRAFAEGRITLGELEGVSKSSQYQMAKVGYEFLNEGKLDQARSVFEGLVALDPYDAYFHSVLGSIAHRRNALEDAERHYSRALEINPFFAATSANRGEIRLAFGRLEDAISDLLQALKNDPELKDPATQRARALLNTIRGQAEAVQSDPGKAMQAAERALEVEGKGLSESEKQIPEPLAAEIPAPAPKIAVPVKPKKEAKKAEPKKAEAKKPAAKPTTQKKSASAGTNRRPAPKKK